MGQVAEYIIDLLDEILGSRAEREARFPWALGDLSPKTGRCAELPFDAYWASHRLIVEVDEPQHRGPVLFWDKPELQTVSGVSRGEQRAIYDHRKRAAAREQGFTVLEIPWERRPLPDRRNRAEDRRRLCEALHEAGVKT